MIAAIEKTENPTKMEDIIVTANQYSMKVSMEGMFTLSLLSRSLWLHLLAERRQKFKVCGK